MASYIDWDASWTATSINSSTVTNASSATTAAISNDTKLATEISVTVAYGGTATEGLAVYVLRDVDGTNNEAVADEPYSFVMPYSTSTTYRRSFTVDALDVSSFKVHVTNDSGASVTVTVRYRQAVLTTA